MPRSESRRRIARRTEYKGCATYVDFRELIGRTDIDAVCIATPEHWHAIPAIEAMKAGKDVYCEKPLTLTLAEAKRCIDAARKYNRVFQTGSQQRSNVFGPFREAVGDHPERAAGQDPERDRGRGRSEQVVRPARRGRRARPRLGPVARSRPHATLQRDPQPPRRPQALPRLARATASTPAADTPTWGAHHYDIAQWCLGMDESGPVEIIPPLDPKAGHGVIYRYANGVTMIHGGPSGCTFTGSEGTLRIDRDHLSSDPEKIVKEPLKSERGASAVLAGPPSQLDRLHPLAEAAAGRCRDRISVRGDSDPRQHRLLESYACCAGIRRNGSSERRRRQQVARPRAPRSVEAADGLRLALDQHGWPQNWPAQVCSATWRADRQKAVGNNDAF